MWLEYSWGKSEVCTRPPRAETAPSLTWYFTPLFISPSSQHSQRTVAWYLLLSLPGTCSCCTRSKFPREAVSKGCLPSSTLSLVLVPSLPLFSHFLTPSSDFVDPLFLASSFWEHSPIQKDRTPCHLSLSYPRRKTRWVSRRKTRH